MNSEVYTFSAAAPLDPAWQDRTDPPAPAPGDVHLWRVPLTASPAAVVHTAQLLTAAEKARVKLLAGAERQTRQILCRGMLRTILGRYLGLTPQAVPLAQPESGKLHLGGPAAASGLRFNLAHSDDLALYAIALQAEVGVDLERRRTLSDLERMLDAVLTPAECERVRTLPAAAQLKTFFDAWALKEACLKTTGEGIDGLKRVEAVLGLVAGQPILGLRMAAIFVGQPWTVQRLAPDVAYAAAVVVTAPGARFRQFTLQPEAWLR